MGSMVSFQSAMNAYKEASTLAKSAAHGNAVPMGTQKAGGLGFGDMVQTGIQTASNALQSAEKISAAGVMKQASLADVVTAVSNAELTLQAIVAVRDKLVAAHQEIIHMPI